MVTKFETVMRKLATLGHNPALLTDCSEVIPVPKAVKLPAPTLPAGKSLADIQASVRIPPLLGAVHSINERILYSALRRPSRGSPPLPAPRPALPACTSTHPLRY